MERHESEVDQKEEEPLSQEIKIDPEVDSQKMEKDLTFDE